MTRFDQLMEQIKSHPIEWVLEGEGLAAIKEAARCAPPEVLELAKRNMRHDELMREIFAKHDLDPSWIHSDEGRPLLAEALSLAPPVIKAMMDAKLKELDLMPEATFCDDDGNAVFTLEQVAAKFGSTVEEVKQHMGECVARHPEAFKHTGPVHRLH